MPSGWRSRTAATGSALRSGTARAPSSRRYCSSSASAGAITVAPACDRELHGEAADAAGGADDEDDLARLEVERVDGRHRRDPGQGCGAGFREPDAGGLVRDRHLLGHDDELGPGAVADGRVGVQDEPEDLVARGEAGHPAADLLDHARVVAAEHDRELVFEHALQHAAGDRGVDGIDRRGVHAHEHLVLGGDRRGQVVAQGGRRVEAGEDEGSHLTIPEQTGTGRPAEQRHDGGRDDEPDEEDVDEDRETEADAEHLPDHVGLGHEREEHRGHDQAGEQDDLADPGHAVDRRSRAARRPRCRPRGSARAGRRCSPCSARTGSRTASPG